MSTDLFLWQAFYITGCFFKMSIFKPYSIHIIFHFNEPTLNLDILVTVLASLTSFHLFLSTKMLPRLRI